MQHSFSVIVPTYNRFPLLGRAVESLLAQDYENFEIIVVNDGSTDGSDEYLRELANRGAIRYFRQQNQGPARARNLGLKHSSATHIAFIDDDCVAPVDWLRSYSRRFDETGASGIGGSSNTGDSSNLFAVTNDFIVNTLKEALNQKENALPFLTSNNAAYCRSSLQKVGGFDRQFTIGAEERDLNFRLMQAGERLLYDGDIVIDHYNDADFAGFVKHQYVQGKGSYLYYKNAMRTHGRRPPMIDRRVYLELLLSPFRTFPFPTALAVAMLIVIAQFAVTVGYCAGMMAGKSR